MEIKFEGGIPLYGMGDRQYGFVGGEEVFPRRKVSVDKLFYRDGAVCIVEREDERFEGFRPGATDYDLGGMILRVKLPKGAFVFEVDCVGDRESIAAAVAGMNPERIAQGGYWDAGRLIPVRNVAAWEGNTWHYAYVNGGEYVDLSLEPLKPDVVIGISCVRVREYDGCFRDFGGGEAVSSIYILGDSTAKSYVFEEAPMSGWGQLFYRMVDPAGARVVNYSNGGRSLRVMYQEGRLNDMLLAGRQGDFVLLQSGHNDERDRNDGVDPDGELARFGRGSTEEMYYRLLTKVFLPAIRSVGMIPVLVTPVTRINAGCGDDAVFVNSFRKRDFPEVMRRAAADTGTLLLDLNRKSVEHFNQVGAFGARAMVMSLEPGETPGKTNGGSYANGNPGNHADGTHYKECLSRQYCRMAVEELACIAGAGESAECEAGDGQAGTAGKAQDAAAEEKRTQPAAGQIKVAARLCGLLREEVLRAAETKDFSAVFPEVCRDTIWGRGSYYRNQIEKMVQLGVFQKDEDGNFHPLALCRREEFRRGIQKIWNLPAEYGAGERNGAGCRAESKGRGGTDSRKESKSREKFCKADAAEILYDAYVIHFGLGEEKKPPYMTDYNGANIDPSDPNFDCNLPSGETMYYPLTPYEQVSDLGSLPEGVRKKIETVYRLGLMRCEGGIQRGMLDNGTFFVRGKP